MSLLLSVQILCHIGLCERIIGTTYYCAIWNVGMYVENAFNFFFTEIHTSDGLDDGHVASIGIPVTGRLPVASN